MQKPAKIANAFRCCRWRLYVFILVAMVEAGRTVEWVCRSRRRVENIVKYHMEC